MTMQMQKFDFEDYKDRNCVMHCATFEEALEFCAIMTADGRSWMNGDSYEQGIAWDVHKENTCYVFNQGLYGELDYFRMEADVDFQMLHWSDFCGWVHYGDDDDDE